MLWLSAICRFPGPDRRSGRVRNTEPNPSA